VECQLYATKRVAYVGLSVVLQATVVCDIIMLYALEERKVYKKSIIDDELRSANMAIAKTAFALVNRAVSSSSLQ